MSFKLILGFVTISGIIGKNSDELDILPPPPPFPDIEKEYERVKEAKKTPKSVEKQKQEEQKKRKNGGEKAREKKVFNFFRGIGLVKKEKKQMESWRKREEREKGLLVEQKKPKNPILGDIFIRKKEEDELDKELEELEKEGSLLEKERIKPAIKDMPELEIPDIEMLEKGLEKPGEVVKAEEEIQRAIRGLKGKKKGPYIVKGLFKKKKQIRDEVEIPEVMPRTYDKIDHVLIIEEKIHKTRLALMDFKFDEAKKVYMDVMRIYNNLERKKKDKVYQDIKDLYYERKSAEKFAK